MVRLGIIKKKIKSRNVERRRTKEKKRERIKERERKKKESDGQEYR